jgi:peptidoglycan/LPS O-acetylase OafA/YrhL
LRNFAGIQAMRGVAAFSVLCGHAVTMRWGMGLKPETAFNALGLLQSGVDIFFVISGFIIANNGDEIGKSRGRIGVFQFAVNRAGRIYPVYWLILAAAVLSSYWIDVFPPAAKLTNHLGLEHIFSLSTGNYFVSPAWSLCFELYFYAAVAGVIVLAPRRVIEVLVVALCSVTVLDLTNVSFSSIYSDPLTLEFGFGVCIAYVVKLGFHPSWPRAAAALAICLFGAGAYIASGGHWIHGFQRLATYGVGSAVLIYAVVAGELNGAVFPRRLQYLGAMSYSLYISHHLLLTWLSKYNPAWALGPLEILIWIALALALSAALYEFFERPVKTWLKIGTPKPIIISSVPTSVQGIPEAPVIT